MITIYAPVIYTAPCIMFLMGAYTLRGEVGALESPSFLGPVKWNQPIGEFHLGPQNSGIPGPNPLPFPQVMYMHPSKTLCTGLYKSQVHRLFYAHEHPGDINAVKRGLGPIL
jgi:hypothetical protein